MLKKLLLVLVGLCWASYSYSESITPYYGQSGNAAAGGNTWNMDNVFPSGIPGLDVQNIIYNYTIRKQTQDSVDVTIQNENALGSGYVFQEKDRWLPGSLDGTQINKAVPVIPNIPRAAWGDGSIQVDGNGSVENPTVIYTYKVDPCFDPQFDPNCPGYKVPVPDIYEVDLTTIYDATKDENIDLNRTTDKDVYEEDKDKELTEEEKAAKEEQEKEDSKQRLEKALAAADNTALFAQAMAMNQMLSTMSLATNMNSYYSTSIPGGTYSEPVVLVDKQLPENKQGLRNGLAQQLLHEKMVEMQY